MKNIANRTQYLLYSSIIVLLIVNYLAFEGIIFPTALTEISAKYVSLVMPADFSLLIWPLIYLGMAASLAIDFLPNLDRSFVQTYQRVIRPYQSQWMILNILCLITWVYEWFLLSLILILMYSRLMLKLTHTVSATPALRSHPWLLKYPLGLHTANLIISSLLTLTTYLVANGLPATALWGIIWTLAILGILLAYLLYLYIKLGNQMLILPLLWTLVGIYAKHQAANFLAAEAVIQYSSFALFVFGTGLYLYIFYLQHKQNK